MLDANEELGVINEELAKALMLGVSFDKAKAIAKTLLKEEADNTELVQKLLNILYGLSVKSEELEEKVRFNIQTSKVNNQFANQVTIKSKELMNNSKQMWLQCQELGHKIITFKATLDAIREHLPDSTKSCG